MKPRIFRVQSYPKIDAAPLSEAWASDEAIARGMRDLERQMIEQAARCFPCTPVSHLREEPMSDIESKRDAVVKAANEYVVRNTVEAYQALRAATDALRTEEQDREGKNYAPWKVSYESKASNDRGRSFRLLYNDEDATGYAFPVEIDYILQSALNHIERRLKDLEDR